MQHGRTEVQITEKYALAHRDVAKPDAVHLCDPETEDLRNCAKPNAAHLCDFWHRRAWAIVQTGSFLSAEVEITDLVLVSTVL